MAIPTKSFKDLYEKNNLGQTTVISRTNVIKGTKLAIIPRR